jgi:multidrug efflux pump subunit AcrA (membrane-fusion protein)
MEGGDEVVLCVKGDKGAMTAAVKPVKLGARTGDRVEVVDGVAAGDAVVVRHVVGLEDGAALQVRP